MGQTVWASGGCQSWYLDADGDPLTWPDTWKNWVKMMRSPNMDHFYRKETDVEKQQEAA